MKWLFVIVLFFSSLISGAQADSAGLKRAMRQLDKALLENDSAALRSLLHPELSFGHSNGWVQGRQELIADGASGKLRYSRLDNAEVSIKSITKNRATVITRTSAAGQVSGKEFNLVLHVLQVWMKTRKGWILLARQSAKL